MFRDFTGLEFFVSQGVLLLEIVGDPTHASRYFRTLLFCSPPEKHLAAARREKIGRESRKEIRWYIVGSFWTKAKDTGMQYQPV